MCNSIRVHLRVYLIGIVRLDLSVSKIKFIKKEEKENFFYKKVWSGKWFTIQIILCIHTDKVLTKRFWKIEQSVHLSSYLRFPVNYQTFQISLKITPAQKDLIFYQFFFLWRSHLKDLQTLEPCTLSRKILKYKFIYYYMLTW